MMAKLRFNDKNDIFTNKKDNLLNHLILITHIFSFTLKKYNYVCLKVIGLIGYFSWLHISVAILLLKSYVKYNRV